MSSKTRYLLMLVALFLAACREAHIVTGTALPTVTETREGVIAAATPTLLPSTPTPRIPTLTPSHTHMPTVPPHPTNTPTLPPQTPTPTLPPITPLPSPADYQLKPWSEPDTLNLLNIINGLNEQWVQFTDENEWRMPSWGEMYSWVHLQLAWFKQEIIWHDPEINNRQQLEWEIALDLALAGEQKASLYLVPLLEQELKTQSTTEPDISFMSTTGFTFDLMTVENLFGIGQKGWILVLSQNQSPSLNEVGAVFAIQQSASNYSVSLINSFWLPYHGYGFTITVGEHTNDDFPEVVVDRKISIGTGPPFNYRDICIYQWDESDWLSILNDRDDKPCILRWEPASSPFPLQYIADEINNTEQIEIISTINPATWPECAWTYRSLFTWNGEQYVFEDTSFDIPSQFSNVDQLGCLRGVWQKPDSIGDAAKIVLFMEQVLTAWPAAEDINEVTMWWFDDEYPWIFRFQLGRYYALMGDLVKAEPLLVEVANRPLANFEDPWPTMAQTYLNNLGDLDQAEQLLAEFNASLLPVWTSSTWVNVDEVSLELADRLFAGDTPQTIITELETLIAEHCTENRYCAQPYYVLGLAYEAAGDEVNAVAAYWQVWHDYPDSYYATIAQYRLVEKE